MAHQCRYCRVCGHLTANMAISQLSFNNADKLGDIAAVIAKQNLDFRYATLVFFNSTLYYGVEVFLRLYTNNVIVNMGTFYPSLANKTRQYVLFGSDVADVEQILDAMNEFEIDNTGKFLIICESPVSNECDESDIMELCSYYRIVDVVFIKQEAQAAVGYTYYPISEDICGNIKPVKLDIYEDHVNTTYGGVYGKKLKNLKLCPLTVSTFIQTPYMNIINGTPIGADGDLLQVIAYGLNTSLKVMTPNRGFGWGWRHDNGTWMGSLADIYDELANFSMTSAALTLSRFSDYQISTCYYSLKVVWVTHPAQMQNVALKLLHPFKPDIRIALGASFLLVVLCAVLTKTDSWMSICHTTEVVKPLKSIVFYAWMICMGQAMVKLPTKSSFLQMTFIWVWYCFLIRTVYQVYLISSLKGKFYEDQFETIEDVISAQYSFGGGAALKDYYIDHPIVYDNWINIDSPQMLPTALNISKGMKFVLAMNVDTAKVIIKQNKVSLHILPQTIVTSPTGLFYKKYSPLLETIDLILNRLSASGLPEKLHQDYTSLYTASKSNDEEETLKIVHFTACYVIIILGWILSAIFFLLEIYFGKIYRHPTERL